MPAISPSPPIQVGYTIFTTNKAVADAWQAGHPGGILLNPTALVASLGIPVNMAPTVLPDPLGAWLIYTFDGGPFYGAKANFDKTLDGGIVDPNDLFTDPTTNWDPIAWVWVGMVLYSGTSGTPALTNVSPRRWAVGFEIPTGNATTVNNSANCSRAASRTTDGLGFHCDSSTSPVLSQDCASAPAAVATLVDRAWERFYLKVRAYPTLGEAVLWSCADSLEGAPIACCISLLAGGVLRFRNVGNAGQPGVVVADSIIAVPLNTWVCIDLFFIFAANAPAVTGGFMTLYVNRLVGINSVQTARGFGLGTGNAKHTASSLGTGNSFNVGTGAPTGWNLDFDDWTNMVFPADTNGVDFKNGSHIRLLNPAGVQSAVNWTGDYRSLGAWPPPSNAGNSMQSATGSAKLVVLSDFQVIQQLGVASLWTGVFANQQGTGAPQYGYGLNGGATVQTVSPVAPANNTWQGMLANIGTGAVAPLALSSIELAFIRDASATTAILNSLFGAVEYLGVWGPEDLAPGSVVVPPVKHGIHNAPYPESPAAALATPTSQWAQVRYGTYVGNGTGLDVPTGVPVHWVWVRPVGSSAAVPWSSANLSVHPSVTDGNVRGLMLFTTAFPPIGGPSPGFRVGNGAAMNSNGVTYQWVAFSDPTNRFLINGAWIWPSALASVVNTLTDGATFLPEAAFLWNENIGTGVTSPYYKGPGHATDFAQPLNGGQTAGIATLGVGTITSKATVNTTFQTGFSAWRSVDSLGNSGLVDVVTYTGDGISSRNIALDLGGNSPVLAIGVPHNASGYFRDPSHVGLASSNVGSGTVTDAIIGGGINYVTVGLAMNTLGIVYEVFALAGTPTPGGWSALGGVPPGIPPSQPAAPPPPVNPVVIVPPTPTTPPTGACMTCTTLATAIVLLASRLQDTGNVHWTAAELTRYLVEAVRTWNALTGSFKDQGSFNTVANIPFYELPDQLPTLRSYNVLDIDLITDIQYNLMEPPTPTGWTGTLQFALADLTRALSHRRDRFLYETGMIVRRFVETIAGPPASGRLPLDGSIMTVRRAAYIPPTGKAYPLSRDDEWSLQSFKRQWPFQSTTPEVLDPMVYSVGVTPPLVLQVAPALTNVGLLDLLVISRAGVHGQTTPCLDPTGTPTYMGIPDDWTWVVKFGALAELLNQQGVTYDPQRAAYCESRWRQGIQMASAVATVLAARIQGQPIQVDGVANADQFRRAWQATIGTPEIGLLAGNNLMAFGPVPNGVYTVTLDVIRNAPVPVAGGDCLGAEAQVLDGVLDYAQHLAMFKEGPDQLKTAMDLLERFYRVAGVSNAIEWASVMNRPAIQQQTMLDEIQTHRVIQPPPSAPPSGGSQ